MLYYFTGGVALFLVLLVIAIRSYVRQVRKLHEADEHATSFDSIGTFHSEPDAPFWDKLS